MKTEITLEQAVGKTLEGFVKSFTCGQMVLTFTDGTFATLGIDRGYGSGDETIVQERLALNDFGDETLIGIGVTTKEEIVSFRHERDKNNRKNQEDRERIQYLALKKKYEA